MLLATTALEWSWGDAAQPLVFLGEWCRRYERAAIWRQREHVVVRNHWDDRQKLLQDERYLRSLHAQLLADLAGTLGQLHGIERSVRFWRILLDPWLARYVAVAFDRWECLRVAFEEHDISQTYVRPERGRTMLRDHAHFVAAIAGDDWNHDFYADILRFEYSTRCTPRAVAVTRASRDDAPSLPQASSRSLKWAVVRGFDRLLGRLARDNSFALVDSYFPPAALAKLNLRLGQLPRLFMDEFAWPVAGDLAGDYLPELRARAQLRRPPANRFESFLQGRIADDLLRVVVESFAAVRARATAIAIRPKVVLSGVAHWFNDLFKHWLAERVHQGATFVALEHGSGIPPLFQVMDFEEEIADAKTTWAVPYHVKHVRLPPNKLIGKYRSRGSGTRLVVIGSELPRYPYDLSPTPMAGQNLVGFEHVCRLHDALSGSARQAFIVKPYANMGWSFHARFVACLGADKVASEPRLSQVLATARIAVCTYPQTTFAEAMTCGAPAMLVYPRQFWETIPQFDGLLAALGAAGIVFFEPEAAAQHINSIWADPYAWWESPVVVAARQRFVAEALDTRKDWLTPWLGFIRGLAEHTQSQPRQIFSGSSK